MSRINMFIIIPAIQKCRPLPPNLPQYGLNVYLGCQSAAVDYLQASHSDFQVCNKSRPEMETTPIIKYFHPKGKMIKTANLRILLKM
jgi:hypothetical protein